MATWVSIRAPAAAQSSDRIMAFSLVGAFILESGRDTRGSRATNCRLTRMNCPKTPPNLAVSLGARLAALPGSRIEPYQFVDGPRQREKRPRSDATPDSSRPKAGRHR